MTFDPKTEGDALEHALNYYQYQLKGSLPSNHDYQLLDQLGISFLPRSDNGYAQMPVEAISSSEYVRMMAQIKPVQYPSAYRRRKSLNRLPDKFCDSTSCSVDTAAALDQAYDQGCVSPEEEKDD